MDKAPWIGLIGLGTMGAALALNMAEKGWPVAVHNRTESVTQQFLKTAGPLASKLTGAPTLQALVDALTPPRAIILMVPAGEVVDQQIAALAPLLDPGDLIIDAGNANYLDTERRFHDSRGAGYDFMGIGVSGGEEGARHGPSIMAGGEARQWQRVGPLLRSIAARFQDEPCAALLGPGGAGHFVKMVHNGIEYADMQMIAETYAIMRDGLGLDAPRIADIFAGWNGGPLESYLIEISAEVLRAVDPLTGQPMPDVILDVAGQKGTGRWTAIEAQKLGVAIPVIEAAVAARNISARPQARARGAQTFGALPQRLPPDALPAADLEQALIAGKILCYAQGFEMMTAASTEFGWNLPLPVIAEIWRAGCIIRSAMLNDMAEALRTSPDDDLIFAPFFSAKLTRAEPALRRVVAAAMQAGIAVPALSAGLSWFDAMRTPRGSANLIQAQRDFFGAHGFVRIDGQDVPHGPWGAG
ncbi:NADP-dependent phosphogluconate dehydrogenase [Paracoccus jeotgali]|uniref:NADP-dependent phosphogluconate dehydrogenase n=1 Tax=Paracoccus jeotgali TaxID=2065379 RepID=UPI0028AEBFF0|nr:NADP-dependent phosphogluconate dehydrogenase [Paracoccus jeotgali]